MIETTLRVPKGSAGARVVHRAYAARTQGQDVVVVEVTNEANLAIALAAAVRPYDPAGLGRIDSLGVTNRRVLVNERVALTCEREPSDVRTASGGADVATRLTANLPGGASDPVSCQPDGDATASAHTRVACEVGWANAALIFTLVHGSTLRLLLPLDDPAPAPPQRTARRWLTGRRRGERHRTTDAGAISTQSTSSPAAVAHGWRAHADAAWRCVLPAGRLSQAFAAARTHLPLAIGDSHLDVAPWGPQASEVDEAVVLRSLVEMGYAQDVVELTLTRAQTSGGRGDIVWHERDVTASTLVAAGELVRYGCADGALLSALAEVVADGARWLLAQHEASTLTDSALDGAHLWLVAVGQDRAHQALVASRRKSAPQSRRTNDDGGDLRLLAARAARVAQHQPADAALVIDELLSCASDTFTWPTHAGTTFDEGRNESACAGHDLVVAAHLTCAVRRLLVAETLSNDGLGVELARWWPQAWLGAELDVTDLPLATHRAQPSRASFAVRWHGERPALLWEIEGASDQISVTAPGLDPTFVAHAATGEALLEAPPT